MAKNTRSSRPSTPKNPASLFPGDGFVAVPKSAYEDLAAGTISLEMFSVFLVLLEQCDYQTGLWKGSAPKIQCGIAEAMPTRTVQSYLEQLVDAGYLKSFHQQGKRGNYFVAICDYRVRTGDHAGGLLDANATTDPTRPVYKKYEAPEPDSGQQSGKNRGPTDGPSPQDQRKDDPKPDVSTIPDNKVETSHQREGPSGDRPSTQDQRNVTAASAQDQRKISAIGSSDSARVLDVQDSLDVQEVLDVQDDQDPTSTPTAQNPTAGDADNHSTSNTFGQEKPLTAMHSWLPRLSFFAKQTIHRLRQNT